MKLNCYISFWITKSICCICSILDNFCCWNCNEKLAKQKLCKQLDCFLLLCCSPLTFIGCFVQEYIRKDKWKEPSNANSAWEVALYIKWWTKFKQALIKFTTYNSSFRLSFLIYSWLKICPPYPFIRASPFIRHLRVCT